MNHSWNNPSTVAMSSIPEPTGPPFVPYPIWVIIILWLLTCIFCVVTTLGNLLVLFAYKLERNIRRQLSNKFIVSLAVSDLIIGMEGFPMLTVYVVEQEHWPLGTVLCSMWLCVDYTLCLVSILTVLLITVDRYCSVCYPARYRAWQTRRKVRVMIILSWIVPFILFAVMIFGWELITTASTPTVNDNLDKCSAPFLSDPYVNMSMYIAYYWTTLLAMSVLYRGIHKAAKTLERKSKAREKQTIALLLGQRCMAQVGVGILMRVESTPQMIQRRSTTMPSDQKQQNRKDKIESLKRMRKEDSLEDKLVNSTNLELVKTQTDLSDSAKDILKWPPSPPKINEILPTDSMPNDCRNNTKKDEEEDILKSDNNDETQSLLLKNAGDLTNVIDENRNSTNRKRGSQKKCSVKKSASFCRYPYPAASTVQRDKKRQESAHSLNLYDAINSNNSLFANYNDTSLTSLLNVQRQISPSEEKSAKKNMEQQLKPIDDEDYLRKSVTFEKSLVPYDQCLGVSEKIYGTGTSSLKEVDSLTSKQSTPTCLAVACDANSQQQTRRLSSSPTVPVVSMTAQEQFSTANQVNNSSDYRRFSMSWEDVKSMRNNWRSLLQQQPNDEKQKNQQDNDVMTNFLNDDDEESLASESNVGERDEDEERTIIVDKSSRPNSWVSTLFTNPVWLFNNKRKVTKAEKRARKAFRTITVIVGTFALFWSPYFIVATVYGFCPSCVPPSLFFTSYYLCYLNSSVNPFAYAFANRLFRKTFVRILRGDFHRT